MCAKDRKTPPSDPKAPRSIKSSVRSFIIFKYRGLKKALRLVLAGQSFFILRALAAKIFEGNSKQLKVLVEDEVNRAELYRVMYKYFNYRTKDEKKSLNIGLILRDGTTYPKSSAFIRLIAPLTHESVRAKVSIRLYDEDTLRGDERPDIWIVQRTAFSMEEKARDFVDNIRSSGARLVVDIDDGFGSIDITHPEYEDQWQRLKALALVTKNADQVWFSTACLAKTQSSIKNKVVLRNNLDKRIWPNHENIKGMMTLKEEPIKMICMGTASHGADFEMIMPALDAVAERYPGSFDLTIIGVLDNTPDRPWLKRVRQERFGSIYPNFVNWFLAQGLFDVGLSPLVNSAFNECKSDIKCLDYLAAGILPVVSNVLPYQSTELDGYIVRVDNTKEAWGQALIDIVGGRADFRSKKARVIVAAQEYIWQERISGITAKKMLGLLESLYQSK